MRSVVVWGNCQAEPVATMLAEPLRRHGLRVIPVPPVFLVDQAGLGRVQQTLADAAVLVSQPVRDEYRIRGCGQAQLAALLPSDARVVQFPVAFHVGPFPYQVNAHGGDHDRVEAPITDYHDLRTVAAAEQGMTAPEALAWWPAPSPSTVRSVAEASLAELARRERDLDVQVGDLVSQPGSMFTISHPSNMLLADVARQVLALLGVAEAVEIPDREFLGARRAPTEAAVADAFGWPSVGTSSDWIVDNKPVPLVEVIAAHLELYRRRPDIVTDCRVRYAERLDALGL